jgi:hypothetical protein
MNNTVEEWRPVVGYENLYEVSNLGRVKSIIFKKHKILKNGYRGEYAHVSLSKNGKKDYFTVHVLVTKMFIGPRPNGLFIDHIDNNPRNNRSDNLEYVTPRENIVRGKCCLLNKNKHSKFYGVSYSKKDSKWTVKRSIKIDLGIRKTINLGLFDSEEKANEAWQKFKDMPIDELIKYRVDKTNKLKDSFSSKSKLVRFCNSKKRWIARKSFVYNGKKFDFQIGTFETEELASIGSNEFIDKNSEEMMSIYLDRKNKKNISRVVIQDD